MVNNKLQIGITGVSGLIGFYFAKKLLSEGHKVIGIDIIVTREVLILKEKYKNSFEILNAEFNNKKCMVKLENVDVLYHFAGKSDPSQFLSIKDSIDEINKFKKFIEIINLLKIKKIIFASTEWVYDLDIELKNLELNDDDNSAKLYAKTKYLCEIELLKLNKSTINHIARLGIILSMKRKKYGIIEEIIDKFINNSTNIEITSPKIGRRYLSLEELYSKLILLSNKEQLEKPICVTGKDLILSGEVIELLNKINNFSISYIKPEYENIRDIKPDNMFDELSNLDSTERKILNLILTKE
jgi:nucleoside-diphosphate-sugar epimerase